MPEQWRWYATYRPEQEWNFPTPRSSFYAETVTLDYHLADGSHQLHVDQAVIDTDEGFMGEGTWDSCEHEGHAAWVWNADPGYGACVRLKRDGTVVTINSTTLRADQLVQLTSRLRMVDRAKRQN